MPDLPRWVRAPLVLDWCTREEIDAVGDFIRYPAFCRYTDALAEWCRPFGGDWRDYDRGYPRLPHEAPHERADLEPPPAALVAAIRARSSA